MKTKAAERTTGDDRTTQRDDRVAAAVPVAASGSGRGPLGPKTTASGPASSAAADPLDDLQPDGIVLDVRASDRTTVLSAAADAFARLHGLPADHVHDALWRREQAGSTALGHGFAIPHARVRGLERPSIVYLNTCAPLDFGAADGIGTGHFLALLVPPDREEEHLRLLAAVARLCSDRRLRRALGAARTPEAAMAAFVDAIARLRAA